MSRIKEVQAPYNRTQLYRLGLGFLLSHHQFLELSEQIAQGCWREHPQARVLASVRVGARWNSRISLTRECWIFKKIVQLAPNNTLMLIQTTPNDHQSRSTAAEGGL